MSENVIEDFEGVYTDSVCPANNGNGLNCQKPLYLSRSGEYWDHAGGHIFSTPETIKNLTEKHYDAGKLLSGEKVTFHNPEDCDGTGFCAWRVSAKQ